MDHVSRPLLVVLAATAALLAVWMVALKPKPVAIQNTPLAATKEIPKAAQAVAASNAANARVQAASAAAGQGAAVPVASQPSASAPTAGAKPAAAKAATPQAPISPAAAKRRLGERRDAAVVHAVAHGKVVVLLFWNSRATDDIATRGALRDIDRHGGRVVVRVVPIANVAQYASVTRGVKIAQSPTTVVIGRKGKTRVIVGLTEPREIAQAVGDALAGR
jgi:hypothetical protein